jgi:hypothetical protein
MRTLKDVIKKTYKKFSFERSDTTASGYMIRWDKQVFEDVVKDICEQMGEEIMIDNRGVYLMNRKIQKNINKFLSGENY